MDDDPLRPQAVRYSSALSPIVRASLEEQGCTITEDGRGGVRIDVPASAVGWINGAALQSTIGGAAIQGLRALFGRSE